MKRVLYLFTIVAAIVLVILVGYYLRYRAGTSEPAPGATGNLPGAPSQTGNSGTTPPAPSQTQAGLPSVSVSEKFGVVSQEQAISFFVDADNAAIIVKPDGQIVKVVKGESSVLSSSLINGVISAEFSYDGKKILVAFGDEPARQESVFDVISKSWQPLPLGLRSAVWSPADYQIAYLKDGAESQSLVVLDAANAKSKPQELAKIHAQDIYPVWTRPNQIFLAEKSSAAITGSLWSFDIKLKKLSLVSEGLGLESVWSKTSDLGLVFSATRSKRGGAMSLVSTTGNTATRLRLVTIPSKCAFVREVEDVGSPGASSSAASSQTRSTEVLYCAIPRDSNKFATSRLPDDYQKRSIFTTDDVYKINLSDGAAAPVFNDKDQNADVSNLKMFNQNLFFINRFDQKVYAVSLK